MPTATLELASNRQLQRCGWGYLCEHQPQRWSWSWGSPHIAMPTPTLRLGICHGGRCQLQRCGWGSATVGDANCNVAVGDLPQWAMPTATLRLGICHSGRCQLQRCGWGSATVGDANCNVAVGDGLAQLRPSSPVGNSNVGVGVLRSADRAAN